MIPAPPELFLLTGALLSCTQSWESGSLFLGRVTDTFHLLLVGFGVGAGSRGASGQPGDALSLGEAASLLPQFPPCSGLGGSFPAAWAW